jgi:hypothetical protein
VSFAVVQKQEKQELAGCTFKPAILPASEKTAQRRRQSAEPAYVSAAGRARRATVVARVMAARWWRRFRLVIMCVQLPTIVG